MMASKSDSTRTNASRNYLLAFAFAVVLLGVFQAWRFYSIPPNLGDSPEARKTVDAMFTALTAHDKAKVATCMQQIEVHFSEGKLSKNATNELRVCHKLANSDSWEQAAKRLYWMIFEQTQ